MNSVVASSIHDLRLDGTTAGTPLSEAKLTQTMQDAAKKEGGLIEACRGFVTSHQQLAVGKLKLIGRRVRHARAGPLPACEQARRIAARIAEALERMAKSMTGGKEVVVQVLV